MGDIYLAGFSRKNHSVPHIDMELVKFNSSGELQWSTILEYKSVQYGDLRGKAVSLDSEGNIYVAGDIIDNVASDYVGFFLVKFDKFGKQIWNHTWGEIRPIYIEISP